MLYHLNAMLICHNLIRRQAPAVGVFEIDARRPRPHCSVAMATPKPTPVPKKAHDALLFKGTSPSTQALQKQARRELRQRARVIWYRTNGPNTRPTD